MRDFLHGEGLGKRYGRVSRRREKAVHKLLVRAYERNAQERERAGQ
ncbi:hypothetical protein GCM10018787_41990 [Streptomyces thermodiastaticus]|nr:hypothetical protein GCM10018787_41990 [Streptomyces thermodiastaticus]